MLNKEVVRVDITSYSEMYSTLDSDVYFSILYDKVENGWKVSYFVNLADENPFSYAKKYCPVCGKFEDHYDIDEVSGNKSGFTCGEHKIISDEELEEAINLAKLEGDSVGYVKEWQNTGMDKQPIYQWVTFNPDDKSGDHQNYYVYSHDRSRKYDVTPFCVKFMMNNNFEDFVYYPDEEWVLKEDGLDRGTLKHIFIHSCEEIFSHNTYSNVCVEEVAQNMILLSERFKLGWELQKYFDHEDYSDSWRIYSKEFAEKCYLHDKVIFCYSAEALGQALVEEGGYSDYKLHKVVTMFPDGCWEEDEAYVVYPKYIVNCTKIITLSCFDFDDIIECELVETFEHILKDDRHISSATIIDNSRAYEVLFTNIGTYAKKL